MALTMWGQVVIQAATPEEDPVKVGTIWVDTSSTAIIKVCTAVSPYTFVSIVTGNIENNAVTDAKLRDSGALSVIGRSANSSGDPADISASAASDAVLRESGSVLGFGTVATGGLANDAVTFAKMQNISSDRLLGRDTASSGDPEEISLGAALGFTGSQAIRLDGIVCKVHKTAEQTISHNTSTIVTFDAETFDPSNFHDNSTNNSRITVGTTGKYLVVALAQFNSSAVGIRALRFFVNGVNTFSATVQPVNGGGTDVMGIYYINLTAGDYVEMGVFQTSGGDLGLAGGGDGNTQFGLCYVGS